MRILLLSLMAATIAAAQTPVITAVQNAASEIVPGLPNAGIAQGSIFVVIGTNLGPATLATATTPFQNIGLAGTSVSVQVNGLTENALMYYASATQVAALLPSATPAGNGVLTVSSSSGNSQNFPITVVPNNLGIFTVSSDGQGAAIVTYPSGALVSVEPAANCGAPYTTCGAANPGDTLILWATGLGPISGSDASGAGLGVAMPNIPLKLWIGGVQATVQYQGRGCCIGEDQINFVVPKNVPLGCAVPLAVQIGNEISNYTVMPIAQVGTRTCAATNPVLTPALVQSLTTPSGSLTYGTMTMIGARAAPGSVVALNNAPGLAHNAPGTANRAPNTAGSAVAATPVQSTFGDTFNAQFQRISVPITYQPFIVSYSDMAPSGTCMVYNTLKGQPPPPFALLADLDSGPNITIMGPSGTQTVSVMNEVYQGTLSTNGTFLTPGNYTITSTGSLNIGPVNATLTIPTPPGLALVGGISATPPSGAPIVRANGFTVTWTGGTASQLVTITGASATDSTNTTGASFKCSIAATAGTMTIPPAVLLALPAGSTASWDFVTQTLPTPFTATGLNLGYVVAAFDTSIPVMLQ